MSRPSEFSQETADSICEQIIAGVPVRQICEAEGMPAPATVYRWLSVNANFQEQYARAKEAQTEVMADEILDIAEDGTNDWIERENKNGGTYVALNHEAIERSRIRIDARKWLMGKLKPKKYSERLELTGAQGTPLSVQIVRYADSPNSE